MSSTRRPSERKWVLMRVAKWRGGLSESISHLTWSITYTIHRNINTRRLCTYVSNVGARLANWSILFNLRNKEFRPKATKYFLSPGVWASHQGSWCHSWPCWSAARACWCWSTCSAPTCPSSSPGPPPRGSSPSNPWSSSSLRHQPSWWEWLL